MSRNGSSGFPSTSLSRTTSAAVAVPYATRHPSSQHRSPVGFVQSLADVLPRGGYSGRVIVFIPHSEFSGDKEDYVYLQLSAASASASSSRDKSTDPNHVQVVSLNGMRAILDHENSELVFRSTTPKNPNNYVTTALPDSPLPYVPGYPSVKLGSHLSSLSVVLPKGKTPDRPGGLSNPFSSLFGSRSSLHSPDTPQSSSTNEERINVQAYQIACPNPFSKAKVAPLLLEALQSALRASLMNTPAAPHLTAQLQTELVSMQVTFASNFNLMPFIPNTPPSTRSPSPSVSSLPPSSPSGTPRRGEPYKSPPYGIPPLFTADHEVDELEFDWQDLCALVQDTLKRHGLEDQAIIHDILEGFEAGFALVFYDRLFRPSPSDSLHDSALSSRIAALNLLELNLSHLGVEDIHDDSKAAVDSIVKECGQVLQRLHSVYTPKEKAGILVDAHRIVVDGLKTLYPPRSPPKEAVIEHSDKENGDISQDDSRPPPPASADTLLPLLILSVLKSNPPQFVSNLLFVQRWRWREGASGLGGEQGFCLVNSMAVSDFLENVDLDSAGLSGKGVEPADLPPIPIRTPPSPAVVTSSTSISSISQLPLTAAKGVAGASGEVVDFIAEAGSHVFGAVFRGLSIGSNANQVRQRKEQRVGGTLDYSDKDLSVLEEKPPMSPTTAPWNAPTSPLRALFSKGGGGGDDGGVIGTEIDEQPSPPGQTLNVPPRSPGNVVPSPSFGLLKKRSVSGTSPGAPPDNLGGFSFPSFSVPSFMGSRRSEEGGRMMVSLGPEKQLETQQGNLHSLSSRTPAQLYAEGTKNMIVPRTTTTATSKDSDSRSIRSFESLFNEETKRGRADIDNGRRNVKDRLRELSIDPPPSSENVVPVDSKTPDTARPTVIIGREGSGSPGKIEVPLPVRRFLEIESSADLKVGEIEELLGEYKRLAGLFLDLGIWS